MPFYAWSDQQRVPAIATTPQGKAMGDLMNQVQKERVRNAIP
jgi:hypothetical protein